MYFVQCPHCGSAVDIPDEFVGVNRTNTWNVAHCEDCESGFDYDDEEVQFVREESEVSRD